MTAAGHQEANDPARKEGGTCYCQGGREDAPPNCARNLCNVNESAENADGTYGGDAPEPTKTRLQVHVFDLQDAKGLVKAGVVISNFPPVACRQG